MHEIKKIHPQSLAKYFSLIVAIVTFVFGLVNFFISISGIMKFTKQAPWSEQLVSWLVSVVFFYAIFWIIGYLFAIIYNYIASKTKGIIIDQKEVNLSFTDEEKHKQ